MARIYCPKGNPSECMATIYDYGDGLVEGSWYPYPEPKIDALKKKPKGVKVKTEKKTNYLLFEGQKRKQGV